MPRRPMLVLSLLLLHPPLLGAQEQRHAAPYAGMESRAIEALSAEETASLLAGEGVGSALHEAAGPFTGEVKPVLYVADVEARAPFYRDVLGFELLDYTPGADGTPYYAEMSAGDLKFGLHEPVNERQEGWVGHQRLYFRVRDAAAHRTRVEAAGGQPGELIETAWMDMFIVRDPDGHEIVFAETDPARHTVDPW